jgi:hypothetical protein
MKLTTLLNESVKLRFRESEFPHKADIVICVPRVSENLFEVHGVAKPGYVFAFRQTVEPVFCCGGFLCRVIR